MQQKTYFSYVRVSSVRQGQFGTSIAEQHSAIRQYAEARQLRIAQEFEELETAAKKGRKVFNEILKLLKKGKANGLIMHKIDRGARNLKDWAELGELIDMGVDIHFAHEPLDLYSRGGRLAADIQAVVAADYIRNLREETKKGFYGRIKQGLYPMPAPIGYHNQGAGKVKVMDHFLAPLILEAFQLYASGLYTLDTLRTHMARLGLRQTRRDSMSRNAMSHLLHNSFYTGLIHIKVSDQYFAGRHEPIVSHSLFDRVQNILRRRMRRDHVIRERFLFRGMVVCSNCKHRVISEEQKTHHYYRCHTKHCPQKSIRGEIIETAVIEFLKQSQLNYQRSPSEAPQYIQNANLTFQHGSYDSRRKLLSRIIASISVNGQSVIIEPLPGSN